MGIRRVIFVASLVSVVACMHDGSSAREHVGSASAALGRADGLSWRRVESPGQRGGASVAYDVAHERTLIFSGYSNRGSYLADTWLWDGEAFSQVATVLAPPSRYGSATAYHEPTSSVVVFGGAQPGGVGDADDTWSWDGVRWKRHDLAVHPSARSFASVTYHGGRRSVIVFGGTSAPDRMWEWDGAAWHALMTPANKPSPPALSGATLVYDENRNRVVLFGGKSSPTTFERETWEWDGNAWTHVVGANATAPSARTNALGTYDPKTKRVLVFGGDGSAALGAGMWTYDGASWTDLGGTLPLRDAASGAYDKKRGEWFVIGGDVHRTRVDQGGELYDAWVYRDGTWKERTVRDPGSARSHAAIAPFDNDVILFGGLDNLRAVNDETWRWNGRSWHLLTPVTKPPARQSSYMAFDTDLHRLVLFGGKNGSTLMNDTWAWDGVDWSRIAQASSQTPSARYGGGATYDPVRHVFMIAAGNGATDTWELRNQTWSTSGTLNALISDTCLGFNPLTSKVHSFGRDKMYYFAGRTFEWNGSAWVPDSVTSGPGGLEGHSMAYDPRLQRLVTGMGYGDGGNNDALWAWEETSWQLIDVRASFGERYEASMAFSGAANALLITGGRNPLDAALSDTWLLTRNGSACARSEDCYGGEHCTDGVCCITSDCGTCSQCNGTTPGKCSPIVNAADPGTCDGARACDGRGVCRASIGAPAGKPEECASGYAVDGVCCDSPCQGTCVACAANLKASGARDGICDTAKEGIDPHDSCAAEPAGSCGLDGKCDGRGACRKQRGSACGDSSCSANVALGSLCDGAGACVASSAVSCGIYACGARGCAASCESDTDCNPAYRCSASRDCVERAGGVCESDGRTVRYPGGASRDCAPYHCQEGDCLSRCTGAEHCAPGYACTREGACEHLDAPLALCRGGCCRVARTPVEHLREGTIAALLCAFGMVASRRRRRER